ncbi:hypothetical protein ACFVS9_20090 [Streptomyces sp. NPDC058008]|uniref:hypothetical protein n=1 Tax=Streptomyces sp. NPDC058008 TaxID=3346303 RepID=UPI0036F12F4E
MTQFRRSPEWEQPVDRHSLLRDPVLTVRQLSRLGFVSRRLTRIGHALVFSTPSGTYNTYLPPVRPSRREIISKRYTSVYEVDMGVQPVRLKLFLPSENDTLQFESAVEMTWQMGNPSVFVASGIRDVPRLLSSELEQAARSVTRGFRITDSAEAEAEVLRAVRAQGDLGAAAGLIVTWTLRLHRDRANIDHERRMQAIDHATTEHIHSEQHGMRQDAESDRRVRRQDELQSERALAYGEQQHEVLLQQQQWQAELREGEVAKIDFYQKQLEYGGVRAWALHLAEHPEDSRLVVQSLREDQVNMIRAKADMVAKLLAGHDVEGYELEGPKELALRALHDILNEQLPGATAGHGPGVPRLPLTTVRAVGTGRNTQPAAESAAAGPGTQEPLRRPEGCTPTAVAPETGPYVPASRPSGQGVPSSSDSTFPGWQPPVGLVNGLPRSARPAEDPPVSASGPGEEPGADTGEELKGGGR